MHCLITEEYWQLYPSSLTGQLFSFGGIWLESLLPLEYQVSCCRALKAPGGGERKGREEKRRERKAERDTEYGSHGYVV